MAPVKPQTATPGSPRALHVFIVFSGPRPPGPGPLPHFGAATSAEAAAGFFRFFSLEDSSDAFAFASGSL